MTTVALHPKTTKRPTATRRGSRLEIAITSALEAVGAGDLRLAVQILDGALEDVCVADPLGRRVTCECGAGPFWPGEMDDHLRRAHESLPAAVPPPLGARRLVGITERPIVSNAGGQIAA